MSRRRRGWRGCGRAEGRRAWPQRRHRRDCARAASPIAPAPSPLPDPEQAPVPTTYEILILGASYGSLLGTKLALAGHDVTLVCLPAEAEAINRDGARVRLPVRGHDPVELDSRAAPGKLSAAGPAAVNPKDFDLVALAMQEPQYGSAGVRELLEAVARAKVPCMSIMNMPPLPYLARLPGLETKALASAYTDASV